MSGKFPRTNSFPSPSPSTSGKQRSSIYSSNNHSRSKSQLPHPKVLPFPDIPVRPITAESSRAGTPLPSPTPTRRSSSNDVRRSTNTIDRGVAMVVSGSADSFPERMTSPPSRATSPPVSSPLGMSSTISTSSQPGPSRSRAQTNPSPNPSYHARLHPPPSPLPSASTTGHAPPLARPIPVTSILNTPNRTQGFHPVSLSPPNVTPPVILSSGPRASSLPTPTPLTPTPASPVAPTSLTEIREPKPPPPIKKLSNPLPAHPSAAVQIIPNPPPELLGNHMYESFLKGTCADVRLFVRKWGVAWKVHKMVLVQAGFFHSLFLGGFSEMSAQAFPISDLGKGKNTIERGDWKGDDVELSFDDPNITRAAFEICLSRLYSSQPHLQFPTTLLPTPTHPLTASFPPTTPSSSLHSIHNGMTLNTHLATPRLLLSLLATTIYLGHVPLMRETLSMVLRTVGPATVGRYLSFAVGEGVGEEEWAGQNDDGAKGLNNVGEAIRFKREDGQRVALPTSQNSSTSLSDDGKVGGTSTISRSDRSTSTIRTTLGTVGPSSSSDDHSDVLDTSHLPHFYGFASNKIGEACSCWLARWGRDLLDIELELPSPPSIRIWSHRGLPALFVRAVLGSDSFFVRDEMDRYRIARKVLDLRRRGWEVEMEGKGDLSTLNESIESGTEGGWEEWEEDEMEMTKLFTDGIYYTHMTFEDLSEIASDIDPTTSLPYVPLSVLQAAHWSAADLKNKILAQASLDKQELSLSTSVSDIVTAHQKRRRVTPRSRVPSSTSMHASTSNLSVSSTGDTNQSSQGDIYHPVPSDDTHRIGAGGLLFLNALASSTAALPGIPGLPDLGPEVADLYSVEGARPSKFRPPPQGEKTAFGLLGDCKTRSELIDSYTMSLNGLSLNDTTSTRWTKLEPYRFSVEFWGIDKLAEKERAYSETHFYAGSWFNVYVQTIRKKDKGTQLGIYLHRQSPSEAFPPASQPDSVKSSLKSAAERIDESRLGVTVNGAGSAGPRMIRAMSTPPVAVGVGMGSPPGTARSQAGGGGQQHPQSPLSPPLSVAAMEDRGRSLSRELSSSGLGSGERSGPYTDPRRVTKAYFSISCASALGTALIRFSSAPDNFTISQSWGWKSSALRSEEYLMTMTDSGDERLEGGVLGWVGDSPKEGSLRATVVVGVV